MKLLTPENDQHRHSIVMEIFHTENNYVDNLSVAVKVFMCAISQSNLLLRQEVDTIFGGIEVLLFNHKQFSEQLKKRVGSWHPQQVIADLFVTEVTFTNCIRCNGQFNRQTSYFDTPPISTILIMRYKFWKIQSEPTVSLQS